MLLLGQSVVSAGGAGGGRHAGGLRPLPAGVEDGETREQIQAPLALVARTRHQSRGKRDGLDFLHTVLSGEGCARN